MTGKNLYHHILEQGYTQEELDQVLYILALAGAVPINGSILSVQPADLSTDNNLLNKRPDSPSVVNPLI